MFTSGVRLQIQTPGASAQVGTSKRRPGVDSRLGRCKVKGVFTGKHGVLWGPESKVQRCLAKTRRSGRPCMLPAEINPLTGRRSRCRFHGGLGGPRTPEGKARIAAAHTTHGRYTAAAKAQRRAAWLEKRALKAFQRQSLTNIRMENAQLQKEIGDEQRRRTHEVGSARVVFPVTE